MLKVYMTGLVYIHGCTANTPLALLPDGTNEGDHHASLWVDKDKVDFTATSWPQNFYKEHDLDIKEDDGPKQSVTACEFRIPALGTTIEFPATAGTPQCKSLDTDLAKLKIRRPDGVEVPFVADPQAPDIIARVPIEGGDVTPYKFKSVGIIEWTISAHHSLQITAEAGETPHTIVLKNPASDTAAEIVLSNVHDIDAVRSRGNGDHHHLYKNLNLSMSGDLVVPRQPDHPEELSGFASAFLKFLKKSMGVLGRADGETPTCCS